MRWQLLLSAFALAASVQAQSSTASPGDAFITIEASHGGAGNDLTNTTIDVLLNAVYTNSSVLAEVSYLFLTSATGVPLQSITCTPYRYANGTGMAGLPFSSTTPSLLSTNTVQVGSIVCISDSIQQSPASSTTPYSSGSTSGTVLASSTTTGNLTLTEGPIVPVTSSLSGISSVTTTTTGSGTTTSSSSVSQAPTTGASGSITSGSLEPTVNASGSITSVFTITTGLSGSNGERSTITSTAALPNIGSPTSPATSGTSATASTTSTASAGLSSTSSAAGQISMPRKLAKGMMLAMISLALSI